jgi:hypothetical protein
MKNLFFAVLLIVCGYGISEASNKFYIGLGYPVVVDDELTNPDTEFDTETRIPIALELAYYFEVNEMIAVGPVVSQRFSIFTYEESQSIGPVSVDISGGVLGSHTLIGASGVIYPFSEGIGQGFFGRADIGAGLANYFDISSDDIDEEDIEGSAVSEFSAVGLGLNLGIGYGIPMGENNAFDVSLVYSMFPISIEEEIVGQTVEVSDGASYLSLMIGFKF